MKYDYPLHTEWSFFIRYINNQTYVLIKNYQISRHIFWKNSKDQL